jgi:hypothetical protein
MEYEYIIHRRSLGRTAICACGGMDCVVTSYVHPADRAYWYDGPLHRRGSYRSGGSAAGDCRSRVKIERIAGGIPSEDKEEGLK